MDAGAVASKPTSPSSSVRPTAYLNVAGNKAGQPSGVITVTSTVPAAFAGEIALSSVELTKVTCEDTLDPNRTLDPLEKCLPRMVTGMPPDNGLFFGIVVDI